MFTVLYACAHYCTWFSWISVKLKNEWGISGGWRGVVEQQYNLSFDKSQLKPVVEITARLINKSKQNQTLQTVTANECNMKLILV